MLPAMKRFTLAVLVLSALALLANTPPSPEGGSVMRYQLAAGHVHNIHLDADRPAVFRIDTATGRAWVLEPVPIKGGAVVGTVNVWSEVHETNGELYRAALQSMNAK